MPRAKPSQAAITNVLAAMIAAGITPGKVRVDSDGGFEIAAASEKLAESSPPAQGEPRKFGVVR